MEGDAESERHAISEAVSIVPYDAAWPTRFIAERDRLAALAPELIAIEHVGSTAVPGLGAKAIIDIMAAVASLDVADLLVDRLTASGGYITSAEFNRTLRNRRWLMRHAGGRRTHHLHLVLADSPDWTECIRFRDVLRQDRDVSEQYAALKHRRAAEFGDDRDAYGDAKTAFIASAVRPAG